jgi:hypothetical protein
MIESPTILTPASAQAEDARQAGAEPLNGNGFYRFKIGNFQATVISDGYGPIPVGPIFAMNASEAELIPVLKANFMPSTRDESASLSIPALVRKSAHPSAAFPGSRRTCAEPESCQRASIWS